MTKLDTEQENAVARLREILPPGTTVYVILRHVSRSYMQRSLSVVVGSVEVSEVLGPYRFGITDITHWVRQAIDGKFDREHGGIICRGAGMDMGWHLVSNLSRVLYPDGFGCIGPSCPANDHVNGDRDYTPHGEPLKVKRDPDTPEWVDCAECGKLTPAYYVNQAKCSHVCIDHAGREHWHSAGDYALRMVWL